MKLISRILILTVLCVMPISAQEVLNIYGNLGYGFGMGGYFLGSGNTYLEAAARPTESTDHFLNLGHGIKLEVGTGYMLAPFLEGRFSLDFSFGAPSPAINSVRRSAAEVTTDDTLFQYSHMTWGFKTIIAPHFEVLELFDMYLGVGLIFNFASSSYELTLSQLVNGGQVGESAVFENKTPFALGFTGVMGFEIPFSTFVDFFAEIRFEQVNHKLKESTITEITPNIQGDFSTIVYEKDDVDRDPPPNIPGSNWGLRFGVKLWLF